MAQLPPFQWLRCISSVHECPVRVCLRAECTHCFFNVGPWPVGGLLQGSCCVGGHHFVMSSAATVSDTPSDRAPQVGWRFFGGVKP